MSIATSAVTVSLEDAELHIRSGLPGENNLDYNAADTSMLRLKFADHIESHVIEVWFVNLERCRTHAPLVNYIKRQIRLMLWCLDVDLPDFEGGHPEDTVPWITVAPGHRVSHLENLLAD